MENQDGVVRPRPRVLDVSEPPRGSSRRRRGRQNARVARPSQEQVTVPHYPLEMQPVLRVAMEYGRRTHALGALRGASALRDLADRIRALGPATPALEQIMLDAERNANELHQLLGQVYEED